MQSIYKVDLARIDGEGDFPCPKCGAQISPDDETENVYTIMENIVGEDDCLESVVLRCNKCDSTLSLEGFAALSEESSSGIEISESLPESKPNYRTSHNIFLDGRCLGSLIVELAQEEDAEAFKRLKKLRVGDPFKCMITMAMEGTGVEDEDFMEIAKVVRRKFKGLEDGDIYIVEIKDGRKSFVGRF